MALSPGGSAAGPASLAFPAIDGRRSQRGFTLIEVLVAVVIFALMAAMAYRGLDAVLESSRRVEQEQEKWRAIAMLFTRLERDLAVVVDRPVRAAAQPYADALQGEAVVVGEFGAQLAFTRMGSGDQPGTLAAPQRVGWRLRDGSVEVLLWPVLDQAPRSTPEANVVASDIGAFVVTYLATNGQWQTRWPTVDSAQGSRLLPRAVRVAVTLKSGEVLTRLFDLPAARSQPPAQ